MRSEDWKVSGLGENGLVDRILARIGRPEGADVAGGDDAAVVSIGRDRVLMTTDELVEDVDFDLSYCSGADVGFKAIAVNASDIAAMCGTPRWATLSLALQPETPVALVDAILEGALEASSRWDIGVIGGDISRARQMSLSVAMIGWSPFSPVLRSGASPGEALCVTGCLGGAAAGLRLLRHLDAGEERAEAHPSEQTGAGGAAASGLIRRQLRPLARVEESAALAPLKPSSMIDLSDGFIPDLDRLMRASHTGCTVDATVLPLDPGLDAVFGSQREAALELAMLGGEDFELLFTIEEGAAAAAVQAVQNNGTPCTKIGTVTAGGSVVGDRPLSGWEGMGWDHLRSR
ncbi:MAG: thiamine-phosphate kinase [Actinomycetota bacterium]|nr:thiamine-phosphate kinase [Actinomycetota bacterium]